MNIILGLVERSTTPLPQTINNSYQQGTFEQQTGPFINHLVSFWTKFLTKWLDQFLELGDFELIFFKEAKIEPKAKLEITTGQEKFQFGFHPTSKWKSHITKWYDSYNKWWGIIWRLLWRYTITKSKTKWLMEWNWKWIAHW